MLRQSIMAKYTAFVQGICRSKNVLVNVLAHCAVNDGRTVTGNNIRKLGKEIKKDPLLSTKLEVRNKLEASLLPVEETWRTPLLARLLEERGDLENEGDKEKLNDMIEVICNSTFT